MGGSGSLQKNFPGQERLKKKNPPTNDSLKSEILEDKLLKTDIWYIYSGILLSQKKKNKTWPFATTWMDLECIKLSEISQTEKDKYHTVSLICGI